MKSESEVQQLIMLEAPKWDVSLMRNNSGGFKDATGRMVFYGLGVMSKQQNERIKSSDLVGFQRRRMPIPYKDSSGESRFLEIRTGIFVAVEVKREGWVFNPKDKREVAQKAFIDWVKSNNCIAGFCQSVEDFINLVK